MRKVLSLTAVVLGVGLVAGAVVIRFVVAPSQAVLPSDTDSTRTYTGTAATLFNASALTTPGTPVLLKDVPITAKHQTKVLATKGDNALVADSGSVNVAGAPLAGFDYRYAVNRTSMGPGSGYPNVTDQSGITFNWPIRTKKQDYPGWISDTQSTTPLRYVGTEKHGGISTYVFKASLSPTPITDPATLKSLPASLPKATLVQLAGGLGLGASQLGQLQQALPSLPDPVPFGYTYGLTATYWVQPQSGEVVDLQERETSTLGIKVGSQLVPVTPVLDISYSSAPSQLAASVKDARHDGNLVSLVYVTLPGGLAIAGIVLLLAGLASLVGLRRRPDRGSGPDAANRSGRHSASPSDPLVPLAPSDRPTAVGP
jgi:hypothetical protein